MSIKKLRDSKALQQQELVNNAKQERRDMTPEEKTQFDNLQKAIDELGSVEAQEDEQGDEATRALENERKRATEITQLCREFERNPEEFIKTGKSIDAVREAILDDMKEKGAPVGARGTSELSVATAAEDKFRAAAADALIMKSGMNIEKPSDGARELMGMSLKDIAIESLQDEYGAGLNRRSPDELYDLVKRQFYNPSSAFPAILDNAINKAYVQGHQTAPVTFDRWTKKGSLKDFKTYDNNYLAGPAGEFLEVPEGGELKHDIFKDEKRPTRKLKTYGRQFTLTRQAFINDDIDLVTRIPAKYAASARKTINKQCYTILVSNSAVYDGMPLFSSAHKNLLASGTGITQIAVQSMIMALQNQVDEFGETCMIRPATIVVPSGYAFDMYTLFYSPTINTVGNTQGVNPLYQYKDNIVVVEDPTINVLCGGFGNIMPWWILGATTDTEFIEVDYLNGNEIPTIRRSETPGTLGFIWDVFLDWGISVMDYRGAIKNPGIAVKNPLELA